MSRKTAIFRDMGIFKMKMQ